MKQMTAKQNGEQCLKRAPYGQAAIESVLSLLLFVMMLGTLISFSLYLYVHHTFLTAAKIGARAAAVESNLASGNTYDEGVDNVKSEVMQFINDTTNISLDEDEDISVEGPTGTVGDRTVTVTVSHEFENPVQIRTFFNRLSGGSAEDLDTFTISDNATMRYEE